MYQMRTLLMAFLDLLQIALRMVLDWRIFKIPRRIKNKKFARQESALKVQAIYTPLAKLILYWNHKFTTNNNSIEIY